MKNALITLLLAGMLGGCGTMAFTGSHVATDPLELKNVCFTRIVITNGNPLHTFSTAPRILTIKVFSDSSLTLRAEHNLFYFDNSDEIKELLVRVDNNDIITLSDISSKDKVFTTIKSEELKNQLVEGDNMVFRLNYYDGYTVTLSVGISDFKEDWSRMLVKCA